MKVKLPLLPPKLEARMKQYGFELPNFAAIYDRVLIYPLDKKDQPDMTAGGIVLAAETKNRATAQRGVIVSAGVRALEELFAHGLGIGDVVVWARFSNWPRTYFDSRTGHPHTVYIVQAGEIAASEDLKRDLDGGVLFYEIDTETGKTNVAERERVDPPTKDLGEGV